MQAKPGNLNVKPQPGMSQNKIGGNGLQYSAPVRLDRHLNVNVMALF